MPILIEVNISGAMVFSDEGGLLFSDEGGLTFQSAQIILAGIDAGNLTEAWYEEYIFPDSPPAYQLRTDFGGYCELIFGDIKVSLDMFDSPSLWPPPKSMQISFSYTPSDEAHASGLFTGTAHRKSYDRNSAVYSLYGPSYDAQLLEEATDYNGNTVPLPRAFGDVAYRAVVRLPDVGDLPTFHKGYLNGTVGTDWHVYDDGVNIDSNVTDNGDGTFSLDATPVGEITVSGSGDQSTLADLFTWACGASLLNLNLDSTCAESPSPELSTWADSQAVLIDFLSDVAAFFAHLFYLRESTCCLVDMDADNGSETLTENDILPVKYEDLAPVASAEASWQTREAVEDATGRYVKATEQKTSIPSVYPYGRKLIFTPFHTSKSVIDARLAEIVALLHAEKAEFAVPLEHAIPLPGKKISFTDESMVRPVSAWVRARNLRYDFEREVVYVDGEGEVSA